MLTIARQTLLKSVGVALPPVGIAFMVNDLHKRTKAAGCFAAMNIETQLIGIGAEVFGYIVKA